MCVFMQCCFPGGMGSAFRSWVSFYHVRLEDQVQFSKGVQQALSSATPLAHSPAFLKCQNSPRGYWMLVMSLSISLRGSLCDFNHKKNHLICFVNSFESHLLHFTKSFTDLFYSATVLAAALRETVATETLKKSPALTRVGLQIVSKANRMHQGRCW